MTTRKNPPTKPAKKTVAKKGAIAPSKKLVSTAEKTKASAASNGAAKITAPETAPEIVPEVIESTPVVQPAPQPATSPWRVVSHQVGPNIYGGDLDFVVDLRAENVGAAPSYVGISAEGISAEFGDAFAFRIIERTAEYVRVRVRRLDENGGSWGGNLVVQVLCVL